MKHYYFTYIGIRSFLSSVVRELVFARHRIILVFISYRTGGERIIVVFIDEASDACRDLIVGFGVIIWRDDVDGSF